MDGMTGGIDQGARATGKATGAVFNLPCNRSVNIGPVEVDVVNSDTGGLDVLRRGAGVEVNLHVIDSGRRIGTGTAVVTPVEHEHVVACGRNSDFHIMGLPRRLSA